MPTPFLYTRAKIPSADLKQRQHFQGVNSCILPRLTLIVSCSDSHAHFIPSTASNRFSGNTVILGLSTAGLPDNPHAWTTTLVSLASFLVGAFLTFRSTTFISPKGIANNRLWLGTILLIQALLIVISAAIVSANLVPHNRPGYPDDEHKTGVINNILIVSLFPPLGFQSGMQIATSRLLGYNELPVNVLTSTYCDLMGDAKLFALHNVKRNRRAMAVILLFGGAVVSGWLMRSQGGLQSVLWLAAGIKLLAALFTLVVHPAKID